MRPHTVDLEEHILAVFSRACRQGRLDVAEHLLRALETLDPTGNDKRMSYLHEPLAEAYLTITRLYLSSGVNG